MEKFSIDPSIEPIVGVGSIDNKTEQEINRNRKNIFLNQNFDELLDKKKGETKEKEKTAEEIEMIDLCNLFTDVVREAYGRPIFDVPLDNIHLIKSEYWKGESSAFFRPIMRAIAIKEEPRKIVFMERTFHELIHFKSYNTLQADNNRGIRDHQTGLYIASKSGKKGYFRNFNEAVATEITKTFILSVLNDCDLFAGDLCQLDAIIAQNPDAVALDSDKALFDEDTFWADKNEDGLITVGKFAQSKERQILNILIDKIYRNNENKFSGRDEVFDEFARVMFCGGIKNIIQLIDHTFEIGTTQVLQGFENSEKDGKPFNDIVGQLEFVKNL
jgi:hypothetical protein